MKEHKGDYRGFSHFGQAWFWIDNPRESAILDEVCFGFYSPQGGSSGEMIVRWTTLDGRAVPQLHVFDDAWHALNEMKDVLAALAEHDEENITPVQFCDMLSGLGFKDKTERVNPNG